MSKLEHDSAVAEFRRAHSSYDKPWFMSCISALESIDFSGTKCLDLCSGNCEFSEILRDRFNLEVSCADYVESHLQRAESLGFETVRIDLDAAGDQVDLIARQNESRFDIVVSLATIEHVFNSDNLLRFAHTVLKPGGILVVNTPNISFAGYRLFALFIGNRPFGEGHHIRFWDFRFLRTNMYLNGFKVLEDCRKFYSLPEDVLTRILRGRKLLAKLFAQCFKVCGLLQHFSFLKGFCCDELTVVCQREETAPLGFDYMTMKQKLERCTDERVKQQMAQRLVSAADNGWLKEHLYLTELAHQYDYNKEGES